MKKRIAALSLFLSIVAISFAEPRQEDLKVSKILQENLAKAFPNAANVKWEKVGELYVADFKQDKDKMSAYFEEGGSLYKTTRYIDPASLPLAVVRSLNERYDLKDKEKKVLEVSRQNGTYYLISFDYDDKRYIVNSDPSGNLSVVKKTRI
jgi:hypothetical protein